MKEKIDILNELGEFTGEIATLDECHAKGYWHRAVFAIIVDKNLNVLLQRRSPNKKLWPNKWDVTVGGHVKAGEFGRQALIRECKEELNLDVKDSEIKYLISSTLKYNKNGYINNHYDECYLITKDVDLSELKLQESEVSEIKYFKVQELIDRINNNYDGLTEKNVSWTFIKKILESDILKQLNKG